MAQRIVVYQGTFDPFTCGHLDIVRQARSLFDEVLVLLLVNSAKQPLFTLSERMQLIAASMQEAGLEGVRVDAFEGLLADYMRQHGLVHCVRGVRNGRDTDFELENHRLSRVFYPELQTWLLPCNPLFQDISSSALKAACAAGRLPANWAPAAVVQALRKKYPSLHIF